MNPSTTPSSVMRWLAVAAAATLLFLPGSPGTRVAMAQDPPVVSLTGVVRDFRESSELGGHPDFQSADLVNGGLTQGSLAATLAPDGNPLYTGNGTKLLKLAPGVYDQWEDSAGREICYCLYDPASDGNAGSWDGPSTGRITSKGRFKQFYKDVPGQNLSAPLTLALVRQVDGTYAFDSRVDPPYGTLGGFYPIDGQLFGNTGLPNPDNHNYHFTFELNAQFTYDASTSQFFEASGDDDLWVFIDGRIVIDCGGTHRPMRQYVDLNRLGLVDGKAYRLDLFFAERNRYNSVLVISTNLVLQDTTDAVSVSSAFD